MANNKKEISTESRKKRWIKALKIVSSVATVVITVLFAGKNNGRSA